MSIKIQKIFKYSLLNLLLLFLISITLAAIFYIFKINNYSQFEYFSISHKIYFFIITLQVILFILILFLTKEIKKNFLVCYFSIFLTLFIIEICLSILNSKQSQKSGFQIHNEFKKKNQIVYPYYRPGYFKINNSNIFPLSSISNSDTIFCNEKKRRFYKSDKFGFNNNNEDWKNEIDIVLIGDSFVHGSCVKNENNIAGRLKKLTEKKVLNLGFSGSGPLIELAILREYASNIKPKILLWIYYEGNDQNDDNHLRDTFYTNYLKRNFSQNLINRQKEIDEFLINWVTKKSDDIKDISLNEDSWIFSRIKLFDLRYSIIKLIRNSPKKSIEYQIHPNFEKIILMAKNEISNWNGDMVFVYLPDWYRYKLNKKKIDNFHKKEEVIKIIKKNNIKIIDIEKEFSSYADPLKFYAFRSKHSHFNETGYNLVSKKISFFLKND